MKMKVGRNELSPCNSGKKYKKCCMQKDTEEKSAYIEQRCIYCRKPLEPGELEHELIKREYNDGICTEKILHFCSQECDWASALEAHVLMDMGGYDAVNHLWFNHDFPSEVLSVAIDTVMEKSNQDIKKIISNEMDDIHHLIS